MPTKKVCCWDLEGPISPVDFAAEMGKLLNSKSELNLQKYDMGEFFSMISFYDDYLIDTPGVKEKLKILEYQPGDTLRIMAPFYAASFTDTELDALARKHLLFIPGCKELMNLLQKEWDIFVISTSYTQFAKNIVEELKIPFDHLYCTNFNIKKLKMDLNDLKNSIKVLVGQIFQKYLSNNKNLEFVIEDLNEFFWKSEQSSYVKVMNQLTVRGGKRKELAVEDVSKRTKTPISEMIALGDSITDINMLQRLTDEKGISISFNGNRFSTSHANVAVITPNNLGVLPVFQSKNDTEQFLKVWEIDYPKFKDDPKKISNGLISQECKNLFVKNNFVPEIVNLTNKTQYQIKQLILAQEKMRKFIRGWVGNLG